MNQRMEIRTENTPRSHWYYSMPGEKGLSIGIATFAYCCGIDVMCAFQLSYFSAKGYLTNVTEEKADELMKCFFENYGEPAGIMLAVTNPEQAEVWDPVLEKHGFKAMQEFFNQKSENDLTLWSKSSDAL